MSLILKITLSKLLSSPVIKKKFFKKFLKWIPRLKRKYPLSYIDGFKEFYGLTFKVASGVFLPRDDSEYIIEYINSIRSSLPRSIRVLDLCCGSGCLGIATSLLLQNYHVVELVLADKSKKALRFAKKNAAYHQIKAQVLETSLFKNVLGTFDIIIFNPPYLTKFDYSGSIRFEPRKSLVSRRLGFETTFQFLLSVKKYLNPSGFSLLETSDKLIGSILKVCELNNLNLEILKISNKIAFLKVSLLKN
ncbi:MAG: class I SAM-dependent methyltransferase [Deltaproteobacteria bacterium]|nr:class I SAM-dependent methyltransferase [Deltaproteobacteria bacterium]